MIKYSLVCKGAHRFEGWFSNSQDFDDQQTSGELHCVYHPTCLAEVTKDIMAPSVARSASASSGLSAEQRAYIEAVRTHVYENFRNVGGAFADSVRKGQDQIYGQMSFEEAVRLTEEGHSFAALPLSKADLN